MTMVLYLSHREEEDEPTQGSIDRMYIKDAVNLCANAAGLFTNLIQKLNFNQTRPFIMIAKKRNPLNLLQYASRLS